MPRSRRRRGPLRPVPLTAAVVAAAAAVAAAASKHLAWLSIRSAARDTECPSGAQSFAQPTCSSIVQTPDQFRDTLGAY